MYDYKYRQVEPSHRKRNRNLLKSMVLAFITALALGLALAYAPDWLQGLSGSKKENSRHVIPLILPPRPVDSTPN